jgi:hypothetical protein
MQAQAQQAGKGCEEGGMSPKTPGITSRAPSEYNSSSPDSSTPSPDNKGQARAAQSPFPPHAIPTLQAAGELLACSLPQPLLLPFLSLRLCMLLCIWHYVWRI